MLRMTLVVAAVLCIVAIVLYWTPVRLGSFVLGGYPYIAPTKPARERMYFIGITFTVVFILLAAISLWLSFKLDVPVEDVEEGEYEEEGYEEEEEGTIAYEEGDIYEF